MGSSAFRTELIALTMTWSVFIAAAASASASASDERFVIAQQSKGQDSLQQQQLLKPMKPVFDTRKPSKSKRSYSLHAEEQYTYKGAKGKWIGKTKQIFEYDAPAAASKVCNFSGVPALVRSAQGENRGVLLKEIASGYANDIGLLEGDVIFSIDSHVMQSSADVDRFLARANEDNIRLLFARPTLDGMQVYNARKRYSITIAQMAGVIADARTIGPDKDKPKDSDPCKCRADGSISQFEDYLVELINTERRSKNLSFLRNDLTLSKIAHEKATYLASKNQTTVANAPGLLPVAKADENGLTSVGESVAWQDCHGSPLETVKNCHRSIGGNKSMTPAFQKVGVGIGLGANNRVFLIEEFN